MKKALLIILSVSPLFGRTDDMQELDFLQKKVNHAKAFAELHPDPGLLFQVKNGLNSKWMNMANMAHQSGLQRFITKDLLGKDIMLTGARSYHGGLTKEHENNLLEQYEKQRDQLQRDFDDLENFPQKKELYEFAQSNLKKAKDAYDQALQNYFDFKKDVS